MKAANSRAVGAVIRQRDGWVVCGSSGIVLCSLASKQYGKEQPQVPVLDFHLLGPDCQRDGDKGATVFGDSKPTDTTTDQLLAEVQG